MSELNIDIDEKMYMKYIDYRNNAVVEGAIPMRFSQWKLTPIVQDYLARLEAKQVATEPAPATAPAAGVEPHPEALAAQIVHAQMVLQDALGYEENDYNVSLTDLALDIETLKKRISELESAIEPFAEAWLQVPLGVESALYIRQVVHDGEIRTQPLGIDTSTLEDAHTAYFGLQPPASAGAVGEDG